MWKKKKNNPHQRYPMMHTILFQKYCPMLRDSRSSIESGMTWWLTCYGICRAFNFFDMVAFIYVFGLNKCFNFRKVFKQGLFQNGHHIKISLFLRFFMIVRIHSVKSHTSVLILIHKNAYNNLNNTGHIRRPESNQY